VVFVSNGQGICLSLHTLLACRFNSATLPGARRQLVTTAVQPRGNNRCTAAAALARGVAAAQNSVCSSLVAATT
jgi:hypothetical protein